MKHSEELASLKTFFKDAITALMKEQTADVTKLQTEFKSVLKKYKAELKAAVALNKELEKKERQAGERVKQIESKMA